jgi:hypothetical protein
MCNFLARYLNSWSLFGNHTIVLCYFSQWENEIKNGGFINCPSFKNHYLIRLKIAYDTFYHPPPPLNLKPTPFSYREETLNSLSLSSTSGKTKIQRSATQNSIFSEVWSFLKNWKNEEKRTRETFVRFLKKFDEPLWKASNSVDIPNPK